MTKSRVFLLLVAVLLLPSSLFAQEPPRRKGPGVVAERSRDVRDGNDTLPGVVSDPRTKGPIAASESGPAQRIISRRGPGGKNLGVEPARTSTPRVALEDLVSKLHAMEIHGGGEPLEEDWFVVGGSLGNEVNFDAFQGERDVAKRVVDFVESTNDEGQWRIFYRVQDSEKAQELLSKVKRDYQKWRREQAQAAVATQRRTQATRRSVSTRRGATGGFRSSGVGRSGSC